jgi:hypothetical protein
MEEGVTLEATHTPPNNPRGECIKMAKKPQAVVEKFPMVVGVFTDEKAFKDHVKPLTDEEVSQWLALNSLTIKDYGSAPINRMRAIMAIKEVHFPKAPSQPKSKSKYADYTTESLVQMAVDNDVLFEVTDDAKILRMRAIMALRAHKVIE